MQSYNQSPFANIPPAVRGLLIANVVVYAAMHLLQYKNIDLTRYFALYYPGSEFFQPYQLVTHLFMHSKDNIMHIFFNMFALYMFGRILEQVWGPKRFLIYYFVTGIGAAALHLFVNHLELQSMMTSFEAFGNTPAPELFDNFISKYLPNPSLQLLDFVNDYYDNPDNPTSVTQAQYYVERIAIMIMNIPTVGASGAVYGVLLAFGMLFPNTELMLIFPPIPIKAKYMVIGYGVLELVLGFSQTNSSIAHFAHLGGMLFGFILIKYWNSKTTNFY